MTILCWWFCGSKARFPTDIREGDKRESETEGREGGKREKESLERDIADARDAGCGGGEGQTQSSTLMPSNLLPSISHWLLHWEIQSAVHDPWDGADWGKGSKLWGSSCRQQPGVDMAPSDQGLDLQRAMIGALFISEPLHETIVLEDIYSLPSE